MDFNKYQERASQTDQTPRPGVVGADPQIPLRHEVIPLLGLVGEVGGLLAEYKKLLRDGSVHRKFRDEVAEELGDILWYVANVATKFDLALDAIATENLAKTEDRWRASEGRGALYDHDGPEDQKLPRRFEYRFEAREVDGRNKLVLVDQMLGEDAGDPLTDNAYEDDGYRFHDVMHLTFAACLGWSPVLRKLLRKRGALVNRTPTDVADVEDGGRAQVIEEAIVLAAYVYAVDHNFLEHVDAVDWGVLRHINQMTARLEVRNRTAWKWNATLLRGFAVWRHLRSHGGGVVRGDLLNGTIEFFPPDVKSSH